MSHGVDPVDLERDPAATARRVQFRPLVRAEHHHMTVEDEVDGNHDRPAVIDNGHPAQMLMGQQLKTLTLGEFLPVKLAAPDISHGCRLRTRRWRAGAGR
jgi:hypothetical protein